jgi:hypothetical protein
MVSAASDPVLQRVRELHAVGATAPQFLPGDPGMDTRSAVMVLPAMEPSHEVLYDTFDGSPTRVPLGDVQYQMAKMRPKDASLRGKVRMDWAQTASGLQQIAVNGEELVPVFSRTPPVQAATTGRVAPTGSRKGHRRRGRRGRGKGK